MEWPVLRIGAIRASPTIASRGGATKVPNGVALVLGCDLSTFVTGTLQRCCVSDVEGRPVTIGVGLLRGGRLLSRQVGL